MQLEIQVEEEMNKMRDHMNTVGNQGWIHAGDSMAVLNVVVVAKDAEIHDL